MIQTQSMVGIRACVEVENLEKRKMTVDESWRERDSSVSQRATGLVLPSLLAVKMRSYYDWLLARNSTGSFHSAFITKYKEFFFSLLNTGRLDYNHLSGRWWGPRLSHNVDCCPCIINCNIFRACKTIKITGSV